MSPQHESSTAFCDLLTGGMVDIYVGPSKKHYQLHKALLCARSPFFVNAFLGSFREATSGVLTMTDDSPEVFNLAVQFIYKGAIDPLTFNHNPNGTTTTTTTATGSGPLPTHLRLFVLADKLQMPRLQECAIEAIRRGLHRWDAYLKPSQIIYIVNNTPPASPLRKFAVDLAAFAIVRTRIKPEFFRPCFEESADFAVDVATAMQRVFPTFAPLFDPRLGLDGEGDDVGHGDGWGEVGADEPWVGPGTSMRANVSQGSEDYVAEW